ncbi:unnamed protein product [Calypogeia fissa]
MAARPPRGPTLDLKAFLLRVQALRLVRAAFRSARRAPPSAREELEQTIRAEVERNRDVADPQTIRFLLSEGRQRLKELNTMLGIQGHD